LLISKGDFINEHTSDNIREDYQIGKVLGTGAFGEVRVCTHRKSNIKRAVKILKKNFLKEEEQK
jgi:serine/threonine protein kinase